MKHHIHKSTFLQDNLHIHKTFTVSDLWGSASHEDAAQWLAESGHRQSVEVTWVKSGQGFRLVLSYFRPNETAQKKQQQLDETSSYFGLHGLQRKKMVRVPLFTNRQIPKFRFLSPVNSRTICVFLQSVQSVPCSRAKTENPDHLLGDKLGQKAINYSHHTSFVMIHYFFQ